VNINNTPTQPSTIMGTSPVCQETSGNYYSVTNVSGVTYTWNVTGGNILSGQGTNTINVYWTSSGTNVITVTPSNSCGNGTSRSYSVNVLPLPSTVSVSGGGNQCNSATLTASASVGTIYWQNTTNNGTSASTPSASQTVTSSGTYYFRSYNACGWGTQGSATVTINSTPAQPSTIMGTSPVCQETSGNYYSVTNVSGVTYSWNVLGGSILSGQGTNTINVYWTTNGTNVITVTPSNSCGNGTSRSYSVNVLSLPSTVSVSGGGTQCNSATLTANASVGTIYWQNTTSNGTSTSTPSASQTVTTSGTYYFRSYNACGWGTQGSAIVTINSTPSSVSVSGGGTSCNSTTLTANGGSGGTIYWQGTTSNGTSTANSSTSQLVTSSGTYYFRAYNSCGWGTEGIATVNINPSPSSVTVSGDGTYCNNATLTASGGSGGTIYWQGTISNGTSTATASTSQTVTSSGTYYFRAYNACGWGTQGSAIITINSTPSSVTVSGGGTSCNNSTLTASGGSGGTIYWQGTTSNGTSTATASTSQTVTSSGTYYFRAYNSCGWGTQGSATVTINTLPATTSVSGSGTFCNNATLTANGGNGGTIYWQGTTSNGTSTSSASTNQTVTSSGTYYFRAYNACGWGTQGSAIVTINTEPSSVLVSGGGTSCNNSTLTASGGSGGTIYWQGTTSNGTSTANSSTSQLVISSGTYYFRSYNSCGWGTEGSATVTINSSPSSVTVSGDGTYCNNATLTASGGSGGTIYWQGTTSNGTSTATASTSQTVTSSGTYYFRAYNSCGWGTEGSATVSINPSPSSVTVSSDGTYCNNATLTASGGGGGTIYWQGTTSNGTSTATTSTSQTVTSSGTYYFRAYNACGWGTQGSAIVTINSTPSNVTVSGGGAYCNNTTLTASGGSGGTIYWQGTTSNGTSTVTASTSQTVTTSGTYYFRAYNTCGWGTQDSAIITINSTPSSITISGGGTSCNYATLTASGGSGGTIYWQGTTSNGTSTANPSISQLITSSGIYYFRAYNSCGWGSEESDTVIIISNPTAPTVVVISQPTCILATGSIVLNDLPSSGIWTLNPGSITGTGTSKTITGLTSGTYNYTVTNSSNCTSSASVDILINTQPITPVVSNQSTSILAGGTFTFIPIGAPLGTTYTWLTPIYTGGVIGGLAQTIPQSNISGTLLIPSGNGTAIYTVTPTTGFCLGSSFTLTINVTSSCIPVSISMQPVNDSMCANSGDSYFTVIANGTYPFTYQWQFFNGSSWIGVSNGIPSGALYTNNNTETLGVNGITSSGNYQYRCYVTNCSGSFGANSNNTILSVKDSPNITNQNISIVSGGTFSIAPSGVPLGTTYTWTSPMYTGGVSGGIAQTVPQSNISGSLTIPSGTGTAVYTITPTTGTCIGSVFTLTVTVSESCTPVNIVTQAVNSTICSNNGNTSFTIVANGSAPYTYQWQYKNGNNWINVTNGSPSGAIYTNETTANLGISAINITGAYQYRCSVTNCGGLYNTISNPVTLTVDALPIITNQTTTTISNQAFTFIPLGAPSGTTYTWTSPNYTGGVSGGIAQSVPQSNISGSLTIPSGTGTAVYTILPKTGTCIGSTFTLTITVTALCIPVNITTQASDLTICANNENALFSIVPNGTSPYTYQWQYNNGSNWSNVVNNIPTGSVYTNANTASLKVSGIKTEGIYQYRCYFTNCNGTNNITSNAVNLTIHIVDTSVTVNIFKEINYQGLFVNIIDSIISYSLTANASSASYQWLNCSNMQNINGEIKQTFTPLQSGNYAVIVSQNGCEDTSFCNPINILKSHIKPDEQIDIYPNPTTGLLTIKCTGLHSEVYKFEVLNKLGQILLEKKITTNSNSLITEFDIQELSKGMYFLKIYSKDTNKIFKVLKQ
jgi:copper chaperone CopZ